jgi:hypothetical protein
MIEIAEESGGCSCPYCAAKHGGDGKDEDKDLSF